MVSPKLYLASGSPRRSELLSQLGVRFEVVSNDVEEIRHEDEAIPVYIQRLAMEKAMAAAKRYGGVCIGADTAGEIDGLLLEKPKDFYDACAMWRMMAQGPHQIYTAVAVTDGVRTASCMVESEVTMAVMSSSQMRAYWETGEPQDKAGGYAIQGIGGQFVVRIKGSYHAVVGLPLFETSQLLAKFGIAALVDHE